MHPRFVCARYRFVGAQKLRGLDQVPRPYVLEPPDADPHRPFAPGDCFDLRLVLIGRALDYLPQFVFTFSELGRAGLGLSRGQYTLAEVHSDGPGPPRCLYTAAEGVLRESGDRLTGATLADSAVPGPGRRLAVEFLTPARIRNDGAVRGRLTFQDLVRALLRRLSSLCYFHCGCELPVDFRGLIDQASTVRTLASDLHWHEQERFSGRQKQRVEMGGVVGRLEFEAPSPEAWGPYLPLLAAGEWVHVGKGTVMGLGKYRVEMLLSAAKDV
jgi:hypothetical protein